MDPWEVAQAQVATKYDPQQNAIQRQLDMAKASTINNEASLNQYGQQGRDIIGQSYGNLYNWLDYGKATQQQQLGQSVAATNNAYDQSIADIQGWQGKSRDYLNNMAAQLGQAGAGLRSNTELEGVVNTQLGRASAARTNYGTSLSDWMAKMGTISDMGISSAHQSEAQGRSRFETDLLTALGQNKLAGTQQETDMMNKLSDIMGLRQSDLIGMYNELAAAEWERQFQQAQLDQQAAEANADLAYKYSALDAENANQAANRSASGSNDALGWAKLQWDKDQYGQDSAAAAAQQQWENDFKSRPDYSGDANALLSAGTFGGGTDEDGNPIPFDQEAYSAARMGGIPAWTQLNTGRQNELAVRQPLQDIFSKLNTGGSRGFYGTRNTNGDPFGLKQFGGLGHKLLGYLS